MAIILAKSGSVGLPDKNTLIFHGRPLLSHTIDQLKDSGCFARIYVSTNSERIAAVARADGVEVIRRPDEYARNDRYVEAVNHAIERLEITPETITIPQVVQPFRQDHLFSQMLTMHGSGVDSVVTVTKFEGSPEWIYAKDEISGRLSQINDIRYGTGIARREDLYVIDNAVVSFTYESWQRSDGITPWPYLGRSIVSVEQKRINSNFHVDIHSPDDAEWMEFISHFAEWQRKRL